MNPERETVHLDFLTLAALADATAARGSEQRAHNQSYYGAKNIKGMSVRTSMSAVCLADYHNSPRTMRRGKGHGADPRPLWKIMLPKRAARPLYWGLRVGNGSRADSFSQRPSDKDRLAWVCHITELAAEGHICHLRRLPVPRLQTQQIKPYHLTSRSAALLWHYVCCHLQTQLERLLGARLDFRSPLFSSGS